MAPRKQKQLPNGVPDLPAIAQAPVLPSSKIPPSLRFPLVVLLSTSLSALMFSFTSEFTAGDLSSVSRSLNEWWEIGGMIAWKATQLAAGWYGGYDGVDLAALTYLTNLPHYYFLTTFYGIRPTTVIASLFVDMLSTYIPFYLLRPVSPTHNISPPPGSVSNRSIINDTYVRIYTTILAAGIHGVVVFGSFGTWLPVYLVTHFDGIRDISAAHSAALPFLIASFLPTGYAAREFLFTPEMGAKKDSEDAKIEAFDPETATLGETVWFNVWGYSKRTRTLVLRTATVVVVGGFHTWLQTYVTVEGAEGYGAAGWASVWALAATVTGVVFLWVGDVEGVRN